MTALRITGATRLYAIIGDPIAQVRSPEVFNPMFADAGIDAVLVPVHIAPAEFDRAIRALMRVVNLDGLLVTVPYKAQMRPFADRVGPAAAAIGAVNALRREADGTWTADMFDGAGFVRGVQRKGVALRGRRVTLYGAGGAGSAIACALAEADVLSIAVVDPAPGRADALAATLARAFPGGRYSAVRAPPADTDMVVNASPVGMRPDDGLPGELGALDAATLVGDVVVSEAPTPIIRHAMRHGCTFTTGRDMHAGQVDALMRFFAPPASAAPRTTAPVDAGARTT